MAKIRSKKIKAVQKEYDWYKKKVVEMEEERGYDRSWDGKQILVKFKKIKLFLKIFLFTQIIAVGHSLFEKFK